MRVGGVTLCFLFFLVEPYHFPYNFCNDIPRRCNFGTTPIFTNFFEHACCLHRLYLRLNQCFEYILDTSAVE